MEEQSEFREIEVRSGTGGGNYGFLLAALVAVAGIAFVAFSAFDSEQYYLTVPEARAQYVELGDSEFRLKGVVLPDSHMLRDGSLDEHLFVLEHDEETLEVIFAGALPDTFADEAEVVATGRFVSPTRFEAHDVVAKCPSRYEGEAPTAAGGPLDG